MTLLVSMTFDCSQGGMETEIDRGREKQREGVQTDCVFLSLCVKQISPHGVSNMSKTLTQIPHSPQLLCKLHSIKICSRNSTNPTTITLSLMRKYRLTGISEEPINTNQLVSEHYLHLVLLGCGLSKKLSLCSQLLI